MKWFKRRDSLIRTIEVVPIRDGDTVLVTVQQQITAEIAEGIKAAVLSILEPKFSNVGVLVITNDVGFRVIREEDVSDDDEDRCRERLSQVGNAPTDQRRPPQ